MKQRAVGATALNEHSSRSHMVFMLSIAGRHPASGQTIAGMLHLHHNRVSHRNRSVFNQRFLQLATWTTTCCCAQAPVLIREDTSLGDFLLQPAIAASL